MTNRDERDRINRMLANEENDADRNGEREGNVFTAAVYAVGVALAVATLWSFFQWVVIPVFRAVLS